MLSCDNTGYVSKARNHVVFLNCTVMLALPYVSICTHVLTASSLVYTWQHLSVFGSYILKATAWLLKTTA